MRAALWTAAACLAFAANSLLCRWALGAGAIDPFGFALIRAATAFGVLAVLTGGRWRRRMAGGTRRWARTAAWVAYAVAFSTAYLRLATGIGALVLFGVTQATMVGWGIGRGDRPGAREWCGLGLAVGGLAWLTVPGAQAPDPWGVALMAAAGVGWGAYSLLGRGAADAMAANCDAFGRSLPVLGLAALAAGARAHWSWPGVGLATASGVVATGLGYSCWYAALPALTRTRAAVVQLSVPILAAAMGVAVLGEHLGVRAVMAGGAVLGGIALAVTGRSRRVDGAPGPATPMR